MGICILFTKSQQNLELVDLEMVEQDLDLEMVEKVQEHQDVHVYPRVWEGQDPHLLLDQDQVPHLLLDQDQVQPLLEVDQGQDQGQEKLQSPSQDQDLDQCLEGGVSGEPGVAVMYRQERKVEQDSATTQHLLMVVLLVLEIQLRKLPVKVKNSLLCTEKLTSLPYPKTIH